MTIPILSTPPTAPSRTADDPGAFVTHADAFVSYIEGLSAELSAWATAVSAVVSGVDFNGTSVSSNTVGTGSKSWTTQAGKLWQIGQFVIISDTAAPANYCFGQVTAYSSTTLTVNVTTTGGSGTKTSWAIGIAPNAATYMPLGGGTLSGSVTTVTPASGREAFIIPHGAAPSAPSDGSIWSTAAGLFARINGVTQQMLPASGGASTGETLTDPLLVGTARQDEYSITDGAGFAIDPRNGGLQRVTLGANRTPTVANFNNGDVVLLMIESAGFAVTWTTINVIWMNGPPTLATYGYTTVMLWRTNSGAYYGALIGEPAKRGVPQLVGYATPVTGQGSASTLTPTITINSLTGGIDTAARNGDWVIVVVAASSQASDLNLTMSTAGYTEQSDLFVTSGSVTTNLGIYTKFMTSSPDTTAQASIPGTNTGQGYVLLAAVLRGVNPTTPLDAAIATATSAATHLVNPPSATPATGNSIVLAIGAAAQTGGAGDLTVTGASSSKVSKYDASANDIMTAIGIVAKNPLVAVDPAAWTSSLADATSPCHIGATLIIRADA